MPAVDNFWPDCSFAVVSTTPRGWLLPTSAYLQWLLHLPELALVPESCPAERALHESLVASPARSVASEELAAVQDSDVRENYAMFLRFRDALLDAGSLEACYLRLLRSVVVNIPPVFIDLLVQGGIAPFAGGGWRCHGGACRRDAVSAAAHHPAQRADAGGRSGHAGSASPDRRPR